MSEILKLANDMKESGGGGGGDGFTLAEVQSVAGEMGMDAASVTAAAEKFDRLRQGPDPDQPGQYHFDREIPFIVSDAGWERMIDQFRINTGATGTIRERADGSREWTNIGSETIIATLTDDGVTSRFELNVNAGALVSVGKVGIGIFLGFSTIIGTAIASKGGFTVTDFAVLALVLVCELGLYFFFRSKARRDYSERFATLVDKIEAVAIPQVQTQSQALGEARSSRISPDGDQVNPNSL